jgi:site-specific DNA recombinase
LRPAGRGGDSRRVTDPAEWIPVATVPAIIDREQFGRAQERLAYNRRMARRNNRVHEYLLRGLVSCGHCRRACAGRHVWRGYDYYVCRTATQSSPQSPGERCPTRHIPGQPLEELVWRDLCEVLAAPEMIVHAMERARGGHWLPQEMQARRANLRRARAGLHQQIERLTEAYLAGVLPLHEYQRRRQDAEGRLLALDGQERDLTHDADRQAEATRLAAHAEAFCQRVRQGLEQADFHRKRELLELLIDRVIVTGDAVEIRYAIPVGPEGEREPFCRLRTDYQAGFPGAWGGRFGAGRVPQEAGSSEGAGVLGLSVALYRGDGGLWRRALLGARNLEAGPRGQADRAEVRQAVRQTAEERRR